MGGRLSGKTAVITGAASGIGRATALLFAGEGACLVLADMNEEQLARVRDEIAAKGGSVLIRKTDVSSEEEVKDLIGLAIETFTNIDILVNNAGIPGALDTLENQTSEDWHRVFDVNVMGPVYTTKHVIAHMKGRRRGSIINLSSVSGLIGTPRRAAYAASKGAIDAATRSLAMELGPMGIRVNSVAPGVVDTALWASNKKVDGVIEAVENLTPLRRWAEPDDIADVITFLASDAARFITGETISADGGMAHALDLYGGPV